MPLDSAERLYIERQVTLARAILVALALVALLETAPAPVKRSAVIFLSFYLAVSLGIALTEQFFSDWRLRIPLVADAVALGVFLFLTPSVSAFWFLLLFSVFALSSLGNSRTMLVLVAAATIGVIVRVANSVPEPLEWHSLLHWLILGAGTLISGLGMGYLGAREREHLARQQFLEKVTRLLQFDRGLAESIRQALGEIAVSFRCEQACLAIREEDLERLFVWKVRPSEREPDSPEMLPLSRSDTFLADSLEVSLCWEFRNGSGEGFGWDRRSGPVVPRNCRCRRIRRATSLARDL